MQNYFKLFSIFIACLLISSCTTTSEFDDNDDFDTSNIVAAVRPKNPKATIAQTEIIANNDNNIVKNASLDIQENSRASRLYISQRDRDLKNKYGAFAVVIFTSLAAPSDSIRYITICQAFMASLPNSGDEGMPEEIQQMVTAWPVSDQNIARLLNNSSNIQESCNIAVNKYDLVQSLRYLDIAKKSGFEPKTNGPFIIAWSPSREIGNINSKFLTMDLSNIKTYEQASSIFLRWQNEIQRDPRLWKNGWDEKSTLRTIGAWLDGNGIILPNQFWGAE